MDGLPRGLEGSGERREMVDVQLNFEAPTVVRWRENIWSLTLAHHSHRGRAVGMERSPELHCIFSHRAHRTHQSPSSSLPVQLSWGQELGRTEGNALPTSVLPVLVLAVVPCSPPCGPQNIPAAAARLGGNRYAPFTCTRPSLPQAGEVGEKT